MSSSAWRTCHPEQTRTIPPGLYNSEEIYRLELERIFAKEWVCPGLAAEVPNPGDYTTFAIGSSACVLRARQGWKDQKLL